MKRPAKTVLSGSTAEPDELERAGQSPSFHLERSKHELRSLGSNVNGEMEDSPSIPTLFTAVAAAQFSGLFRLASISCILTSTVSHFGTTTRTMDWLIDCGRYEVDTPRAGNQPSWKLVLAGLSWRQGVLDVVSRPKQQIERTIKTESSRVKSK